MCVDFEYCSLCRKFLSEYCFNCCIVCGEKCDDCDDCDNEYLITLNKTPCFLCDNCSLGFDDSDPHIDLNTLKILRKKTKCSNIPLLKY